MIEVFKNSKEKLNDFESEIALKYSKILDQAGKADYREYAQMLSFIEIIKKRLPNHDKFFVFNILVGSTVSNSEKIKKRDDFKEPFSVKNFLDLSIEERDSFISKFKNK